MNWAMRYTCHLGYLLPELRPQFAATVGTNDPDALVRHAASIGMAGILYPWALSRPPEEVAAVRTALARYGLACSCVVSHPMKLLASSVWTDRSSSGRARLARQVRAASEMAASLGSGMLTVLIGSDPERSAAAQWEDVAANLREMAAIAGDHGLAIGLEPFVLMPQMLLRSTAQAVEMVRAAGSPNIGIIYDTGHSSMMDGDILAAFIGAYEHISLIQLSDQPGRVEPGAGGLDLVAVAVEAARRGYQGLIDFEHNWLEAGRRGEERGFERLREFDALVSEALAKPR